MGRYKSKEEAFKCVAGKRVKRILKDLDLLGNCGNRHNYSYTDGQVDKIFSTIEAQMREARSRFNIDRSRDFEL